MDILVVIIGLLLLLCAATWSSARSYFMKGRLAGMEEATREIIRGLSSHYEIAGQAPPDNVTKAVEAIKSSARAASSEKSIHRYQARLWIFGDAVGAACWRKGYAACKLQMTPAEDKVRIDLSIGELLHLTSLAHLGFKKMMPNDRGIEMDRFDDEEHALAGTFAVERLEQAIPETHRPFDHAANRQALIRHWWPLARKSAYAGGPARELARCLTIESAVRAEDSAPIGAELDCRPSLRAGQ